MRSDAFGPRTWLLATVAGWAMLAWGLALFGMGGRINPLADDPSLVPALPKLRAPLPERLGPLAQYGEIASRPLFSENRQPESFFISGEEGGEQPQTFEFVLSSVLITPGLQMAILQATEGGEPIRVKLGESPEAAPAYRLVEIHPRSVVIAGPDGQRTLELRVFDGVGGQAPTASTPPPAPPVAIPGSAPSVQGMQPQTAAKPTSTTPAATDANDVPVPPATTSTAEPVMTTEQQMDAIRKRIEARRAQLRQQEQGAPPPDKTK